MHLHSIRTYNFRNLSNTQIEFPSAVTVIVGNNGNGKTNLVEAISVVATGRSFRTSSTSELIKYDEREASVFGEVDTPLGKISMGVTLEKKGRSAFLNDKRVSNLSDYLGYLVTVTFTPFDLALVKGQPSGRRKLIDRHMIDIKPALLNSLVRYQRALDNKNSSLRSGKASPDEIIPWNAVLAEEGARIADERDDFVRRLEERAREAHIRFAACDGELGLKWSSSWRRGEGTTKELIMQALQDAMPKEIARQVSTTGPHRDDLLITFDGKEARAFASQGQTRSIVLSIKLGLIRLIEEALNDSPVVLLDDVDSELDPTRSGDLFSSILSGSRQVIITGTRRPPSLPENSGVMEMVLGVVK